MCDDVSWSEMTMIRDLLLWSAAAGERLLKVVLSGNTGGDRGW